MLTQGFGLVAAAVDVGPAAVEGHWVDGLIRNMSIKLMQQIVRSQCECERGEAGAAAGVAGARFCFPVWSTVAWNSGAPGVTRRSSTICTMAWRAVCIRSATHECKVGPLMGSVRGAALPIGEWHACDERVAGRSPTSEMSSVLRPQRRSPFPASLSDDCQPNIA